MQVGLIHNSESWSLTFDLETREKSWMRWRVQISTLKWKRRKMEILVRLSRVA